MIKNFLILALLSFAVSAQAQLSQLLTFPKKCITHKVEHMQNGEIQRNYYNEDCINYTLVRGTDNIYDLRPGKNTLMRIQKGEKAIDPWKASGNEIRIYPGKMIKANKVKPVVYALPVVNGRTVGCQMQEKYVRLNGDSILLNTTYFRMEQGDTVCAVRSGVACQDVPNNILYVYHDDGSIAIYHNVKKAVKHTDRIIAGQPIGTLAEGKKGVRVILLYIFRDDMKLTANLQFPYTGVIPTFRTTDGDMTIDKRKLTLTALTDDQLIMQELTSKEKKKMK